MCCIVLLSLLGCGNQRDVAPYIRTTLYQPKISGPAAYNHDFGIVLSGKTVTHRFVFPNTSSQPLIIDHVSSSCRCAAADWQTAPLSPSSVGWVDVSYAAGNEVVNDTRNLTVCFNDTNYTVSLSISAKVRTPITITPQSLTLRTLRSAPPSTISFTIENFTGSLKSPLVARFSEPWTQVLVLPVIVGESPSSPLQRWAVTATLDPSRLAIGRHNKSLALYEEGDHSAALYSCIIGVDITAPISVLPTAIVLKRDDLENNRITCSARLSLNEPSLEDDSFTIVEIDNPWEEALKVSWQLENPRLIELRFSRCGSICDKPQSGSLQVCFKDHRLGNVTIPLSFYNDK